MRFIASISPAQPSGFVATYRLVPVTVHTAGSAVGREHCADETAARRWIENMAQNREVHWVDQIEG